MSVLGRGRGSWKKPTEQLPGGLAAELLPGEYQRAYSAAVPPDWPGVAGDHPDVTGGGALELCTQSQLDSTTAAMETCSLYSLEQLRDDEDLTAFVKEVLCERLFTCHLAALGSPPSVVLYEDSVNMNLRFAEQTALLAAPVLLKGGMSQCVRVTHVADKMSFVYVRLTEQYFELLTRSLNMAMRLKSETKRKRFAVCKKDTKKLCLLQKNSDWYRVSVQSTTSPTEVLVKLVDVGSSVSVDPFSLIVLDSISAVFSSVPPQAVGVVLDTARSPPHLHDLLARSHDQGTQLLMEVLKSGGRMQPPLVAFKEPTCDKDVSPKIVVDSSANSVRSPVSASPPVSELRVDKQTQPTGSSSTQIVADGDGDLRSWKVLVGKHFKVYIALATSPTNIMLQLSKDRQALEMLMEMIQEHYEGVGSANIADSPGDVQVKALCAVYFKDWWYRARVVSVHGEDVTLHLMDYGNQVTAPLRHVCKLPKELGQDVLPFQCVRAELKGVKERLASTESDSCSALEALVSQKTLLCKVWGVEKDGLCPACIEVDLYDDAGNSVLDIICPPTTQHARS